METKDINKIIIFFITAFNNVYEEFTDRMVKMEGNIEKMEGNLFKGDGIVILVSYTGKISGRMIINIPEELGIEIHNILTEDDKTKIDDDVLITMNEFGNMVAGNAITHVNNKYRGYNVRLAPPSSFSGKDLMFFNFKMDAYNVLLSDGKYKINYNLAFKEEE